MMRTESTTDSVHSLPGECHSNPFTKLSVMPMINAPITRTHQTLYSAEDDSGECDQGKA
jgi:hypothetical protein